MLLPTQVDSNVPNVRAGEGDKLALVTCIRQDLLVTGH